MKDEGQAFPKTLHPLGIKAVFDAVSGRGAVVTLPLVSGKERMCSCRVKSRYQRVNISLQPPLPPSMSLLSAPTLHFPVSPCFWESRTSPGLLSPRGEGEKWPEGSACTRIPILCHHPQHKVWDSPLELHLLQDGQLCRHPETHSRKKGRFLHT